MRSREFRAEVARIARDKGRGFKAKIQASQGLVHGLSNYSVNYICKYEPSPILLRAQDYLFDLDSVNPVKLQMAATQARQLYLDFIRTSPSSPLSFEVLMLELVMNGLFLANPGMRHAAQEAISGSLATIWDVLDDGYVFGQGLYGSAAGRAEAMMRELFACAQVNSGLSYC